MASFILFFLIYIIEGLIFFQYCSTLFKHVRSRLLELLLFTGSYMLLFFISQIQLVWLNTASFLLLNILLLLLAYSLPALTAILHASIATVLMGLSELVVVSFFSHFTNSFDYVKSLSSLQPLIIMTVVSKLLYFLLLMATSIALGKKEEQKNTTPIISLHFMVIPLITCFIAVTFTTICLTNTFSSMTEWLITISSFLLLLLNVVSIELYGYYQNKQRQFAETRLLLQMDNDRSYYYKLLQHESESRSILIHDIKNHLQSLSYLCAEKDYAAVQQYISNLFESTELNTTIRLSESDLLNAILTRYRSRCQDKNISFITDIRFGAIGFLSDEDITSLFSNLLDNALESALLSQNAFVELNATIQASTPYTMISMENSCAVQPPMSKDGTLLTKKSRPGIHGYGMKSILRVIDKYNGSIKYYYDTDKKVFHTIILLRQP